jgi:hypothetical protein
MHRMNPGYFDADFVYRSLAADVPLREEPDEDDDEEEDSNNPEGDDEYDGTRSSGIGSWEPTLFVESIVLIDPFLREVLSVKQVYDNHRSKLSCDTKKSRPDIGRASFNQKLSRFEFVFGNRVLADQEILRVPLFRRYAVELP